jgi:HD superfamily phosphohydrolase
MPDKEFRDAVHGDIRLNSFEWAVVNTPEFQRMRGIRQLGLANLIYPSAQHSRFEHSLGVAHMSTRIVEAIRRNGGAVSDQELGFIRALGMVHDIGHIPFGHTLEDERPVFSKKDHHDCAPRLLHFLKDTELATVLKSLGKAIGYANIVDDLVKVIERTHEAEIQEVEKDRPGATLTAREKFFADVVGNTICGDLLDYLKRDPYFTGLQHRYDESIITAFKIKDDTIYLDLDDGGRLDRKIASEILNLLRLRYTLGERVYFHPTKTAASAMISKAVELSGLSAKSIAAFRDEELLFVLENAETNDKLRNGESIKNAPLVRDLVRKIRGRRLYVPAYTLTAEVAGHFQDEFVKQYHDHDADKMTARAEAEKDLAKRIGANSSQVIIFCPAKGMATKAADVIVQLPNNAFDRLQKLCQDSRCVEDKRLAAEIGQLKENHLALWQLIVFLDPDCISHKADLSAHCQERFHNLPNCLPGSIPMSVQGVRDRLLLQAITTFVPQEELDVAACNQLTTADFFEEREAWTVEKIQERLPRKKVKVVTQPSLLMPEGESASEDKKRAKKDQEQGKKS